MGDFDSGKFGHKLDRTGSNLFFCCCGRARNIFGCCRAINILGHGRGFFTCLQLALLAIWATWTLGDLSFGWLELWVTWALGDLSFGWLELWQFGKLGHWTAWVTCTLDNLGDLTNNWEIWCIEKLDSRFSGWKYFRLVFTNRFLVGLQLLYIWWTTRYVFLLSMNHRGIILS